MILERRRAADIAIGRLAVRADQADALAARLCVERMLGAIELRPDGLPPSAILCVRELRDPRPGTLSLASRQLGPPPVWEQAVRREVDRLARAAARPAHGAVPATAEAVVFADDSELLACLGSDLVAGAVGARWWWRFLVGAVESPRRATVAAWLRAPEHAPAALHALAVRGEAAAFVQLLDDREADALAAAVGQAFGLPAPAAGGMAAPASAAAPAPSAASHGAASSIAATPTRASASTVPLPAVAPWSAMAPEADRAGLAIEQRALLGTALALVRAPALARSADFAIDLAAWRAAAASCSAERSSATTERGAPSGPQIAPIAPPPVALPTRAGGSTLPASTSRTSLAAAAFAVDEPTSPGRPAAMRAAAGASETSPTAPSVAAASGLTDVPSSSPYSPWPDDALATTPVSVDASPAAEPPRWSPATPRTPAALPRRGRAFGPPIHTRLGGAFYLVNLALYLHLYGDGENLPLPLWDFVALIARALLGEPLATAAHVGKAHTRDGSDSSATGGGDTGGAQTGDGHTGDGHTGDGRTGDVRIGDACVGDVLRLASLADDPVWELLAELAGRSGDDAPGAGFVPPAEWRLPRAWLIPFTPGPVQFRIADGRLVIRHGDGFAIVDVPLDGEPAAQLAAELAVYAGAIGPAHAALTAPSFDAVPALPPDPAQGWVARLVPYARARLRRALGVEDDEIAARLLVHTARVHATATHVDVVQPLDALPIEVRFAGLDRDPGWVPAAGRFIAFHFE